jgi:tetratricopeptide (TPR) repeat protein
MGYLKYAVIAYKQALKINPDLHLVNCRLGMLYVDLGHRQKAVEILRYLKKRDKDLARELIRHIKTGS